MFVPCFVVHCFVLFLVLQSSEEERAGCFTLSSWCLCDCYCSVALATGWSAGCNCGISRSHSLRG